MTAPGVGGRWTVLPLAGEMDVTSAPTARVRIGQMTVDPPAFVVLDLGELRLIDSTGLGVLVGALRRVREQRGELRIAGAGAAIRRVFTVTGLDRVVRLFDTVEEACTAPLDGQSAPAEGRSTPAGTRRDAAVRLR